MAINNNVGTEIEFNSMVAILRRLDSITYNINTSRKEKDFTSMVDFLIEYYKEISPDLSDKEDVIWKDLKVLKRFTSPIVKEKMNFILNNADEIDVKLRRLAKAHGYLTKNIKNSRQAIVDMG